MQKKIPRMIIAAASSGCGKTTTTMGLIRSFLARGVEVYPFKIGPDYIDPGFHSLCAGKPCYNLDPVLMGDAGVKECLSVNSKEGGLAIIEGVMGLYDGKRGSASAGSTAAVARLTRTPVIVILDAKATARTAGAVALGMVLYDPVCPVAGFILNRLGSRSHFEMVRRAVEEATGLPVVGWLPYNEDLLLPERHLGLVAAWEQRDPAAAENPVNPVNLADKFSSVMQDTFDFDTIRELACRAEPLEAPSPTLFPASGGSLRIAVALDDAFHFYYQDNFDILNALGAELLFFSPIHDRSLPEGISGIYLGGGYPENYAAQLEANREMRDAVYRAADKGMPVFAECGGFMYLADAIITEDRSWTMTGIFKLTIRMTGKLAALGYYQGATCCRSVLGPAGLPVTGHIFHWSEPVAGCSTRAALFRLEEAEKIMYEGYVFKNTIGSYLHMHFRGTPEVAGNFVANCRIYNTREGKAVMLKNNPQNEPLKNNKQAD